MTTEKNAPELPAPYDYISEPFGSCNGEKQYRDVDVYSADQMLAYAKAYAAAQPCALSDAEQDALAYVESVVDASPTGSRVLMVCAALRRISTPPAKASVAEKPEAVTVCQHDFTLLRGRDDHHFTCAKCGIPEP